MEIRMFKNLFLASVLVLAFSMKASAQAPNIVQYDQQVFSPGVNPATGTPIFTNTYQVTGVTCNQPAPTVPPTVTNPTKFAFDDQANAGRFCTGNLVSTLLPALPNGVGYVTTMTQTDNLGQSSPRSAASNPFNRQGVPAILANVKNF